MSREQPYEDKSRTVLVYNTDTTPAPGYALLEVTGYDTDNNWFTVQKPTKSGGSDYLINGPTPIDSKTEGIALVGPFAPVGWFDDGSMQATAPEVEVRPAPGSTLGASAGNWFACPRFSGFTVIQSYGSTGNKLALVRPMKYSLVEYVEVTGPNPADGTTPTTLFPAKVRYFDPLQDAFVDPPGTPPQVWAREETGIDLSVGDRISALLSGTANGFSTYIGKKSVAAPIFRVVNTTTGPLPACVYLNGGAGLTGVGDTLTATVNGVFPPQDTILNSIRDPILIKDQYPNNFQNGVYILTDVGSVTKPWILTRMSGADVSSGMLNQIIFVQEGFWYGGTQWTQTGFGNTGTNISYACLSKLAKQFFGTGAELNLVSTWFDITGGGPAFFLPPGRWLLTPTFTVTATASTGSSPVATQIQIRVFNVTDGVPLTGAFNIGFFVTPPGNTGFFAPIPIIQEVTLILDNQLNEFSFSKLTQLRFEANRINDYTTGLPIVWSGDASGPSVGVGGYAVNTDRYFSP